MREGDGTVYVKWHLTNLKKGSDWFADYFRYIHQHVKNKFLAFIHTDTMENTYLVPSYTLRNQVSYSKIKF